MKLLFTSSEVVLEVQVEVLEPVYVVLFITAMIQTMVGELVVL